MFQNGTEISAVDICDEKGHKACTKLLRKYGAASAKLSRSRPGSSRTPASSRPTSSMNKQQLSDLSYSEHRPHCSQGPSNQGYSQGPSNQGYSQSPLHTQSANQRNRESQRNNQPGHLHDRPHPQDIYGSKLSINKEYPPRSKSSLSNHEIKHSGSRKEVHADTKPF